jgi:hypothetical protein
MNCANCGSPLADSAKFCPTCGQSIISTTEAAPEQYPSYAASLQQPAIAPVPGTEKNKLYAIPLIFSLVGAILLIVDDFGGWYSSSSTGFGYVREWGWINIWTAAAVVIIPLVIAFLYCTFISFLVARSKVPPPLKHVRRAFFVSILVLVVVLVGGAAFIAATWDAAEQWLDLGFYGSAIGSLVSTMFLGMEVRRLTPKEEPQPQYPYPAYGPTQPPASETYPQPEYQVAPQYQQPPAPQPQYAPQPQQPQYQQPQQPQHAPAPPPQTPTHPYQCPNCTAPLQPGARFCPSCGTQLM